MNLRRILSPLFLALSILSGHPAKAASVKPVVLTPGGFEQIQAADTLVNGSGTAYSTTTGTVTSITAGTGLSGGTITGSGTIALGSIAANSVLANFTASSAVPTASAVPSCSGSTNAISFTLASGFGCQAFGTVVTQNTGTSGATVPLLSTANTWSSNQTFNGTSNAFSTSAASNEAVFVDSPAGQTRTISFTTGGTANARWNFGATATAESGSNAGSNFALSRFSDTAAFIDQPIQVTRSTGVVTMPDGLLLGTLAAGPNVVCDDASKNLTSTCTGALTLNEVATQAANTVVANVTGSTASPTAASLPSCSTANCALQYTSGTGFGTGTVTAAASGKTPIVNNSITFAGTDATTMTFPTTSATIARTDAAQTFTGAQTFASGGGVTLASGSQFVAFGHIVGLGASISSCTSPTGATGGACAVTLSNGSFSGKLTFSVTSGSFTGTTMTVTFPTAASNGYLCDGVDITNGEHLQTTALTTTVTTLTLYNAAGTATAPGTADVLYIKCSGV